MSAPKGLTDAGLWDLIKPLLSIQEERTQKELRDLTGFKVWQVQHALLYGIAMRQCVKNTKRGSPAGHYSLVGENKPEPVVDRKRIQFESGITQEDILWMKQQRQSANARKIQRTRV